MKNLFTIIISILLVISLTSSLVGNTPPTFRTFVSKCSDVSIEMKEVYSIFTDDIKESQIGYMETTGEWYDFLIHIFNGFTMIINYNIVVPLAVVYKVFTKFDKILDLFKGFYESAIYLLFGEKVQTN